MFNSINKVVGFLTNPMILAIIIIGVGLLFILLKKRRRAIITICLVLLWLWFWSMPITGEWLALPLEREYPVQLAEDMPEADAIVVMGGGVWGSEEYPYATLKDGADRAWHAARLWKAGKAPIIIPSNKNAEYCDVRLLVDLGVPLASIVLENKALNTEENAKYVATILRAMNKSGNKTRILLVTSACHMRRSLYMFEKYAPDILCIPAATDYYALPWENLSFRFSDILPDLKAFVDNNSLLHEYVGYWGYKIFR